MKSIFLNTLYFHALIIVLHLGMELRVAAAYHHQENAVRQFIGTNQFIEFDMMRRLQIANPQTYLEARYA